MFRKPFFVAALAVCFASYAIAQDGPRLSKPEERQKFHPTPVRGMPADVWLRGYDHRLRLKAQSPFGGLKWRNIGPSVQGGRVQDIKAPLGDPDKLFVAFATGGLWLTEDDGMTWTSLFDDQSAFGIGAIAVSRDGKTVWVGSGEANSQRTSYSGTGIFKSTDGGKTWQNMGLPESHHIGQVLIDPRNENVVYVAAMGHLYSQNPERGVYKTTDGGKTWQHVLKVDEYTGAIDLALDPKNPDILLASMWDRDRRAWNFRESGKGSGVYRTENAGRSWSKVTTLPSGDPAGRTGLAISASNPKIQYAFVDNQGDDGEWDFADERAPSGRLTARRFLLLNDETLGQVDVAALTTFLRAATNNELKAEDVLKQVKEKKLTHAQLKAEIEKRNPDFFRGEITGDEIYRSDDGGKTWRRTDNGRFGQMGGYYWGKTWVNPYNPDDIYVMGLLLLRSTDGGKTWKSVAERAHVDHHAVWNDPRNPKKTWIGNDGGLYLSYDGGENVRHINTLNVGQATTIAVDNKRPYNVYIGLQDNGTMKGPSNYRPGVSDINAWKDINGGDGSHIAVDPRNDGDIVYVAYQFGAHAAINQATNERWNARANAARGETPLRYNWISPLIISSHHPDIVYLGSQKLHRSFNQGRRWEAISPDLTKNRPNGDVPHSTIKDISESPFRFGLIYVGCDDGNMKMTADGGSTWIDIPTPQPDKWVSRVVASKYDENTVYVTQNGYREDDFTPYVWKSTDRGKTWRSIVGNLPTECVNVIREDPDRKDILYVGTDMGVYVTFDNGTTWETLHGAVPNTPVHDIAIQPREKEMVIASHARSVYALPLKYVHLTTPELRGKDVTILEAEDARRSATWGFDRRDVWDRSAPRVPTTSVVLFTKEPGKGTVRIKDKAGKVVREKAFDAVRGYNFVDIELETVPGKPIVPTKPTPAKTAADALKDPYAASRPQYIPIGDYVLEVQVGDKTVTKDWKMKE
ncbi:MAG: WD40/YVTN/BNR-like repeat-containing protein [Fimbriimonas sp.]